MSLEEIGYNGIVLLTALLAIIAGIFYKRSNAVERSFSIYILLKAIFEFIAVLLGQLLDNNLVGLHVYTLLQYIVLAFFFKSCLKLFEKELNMRYVLIIGIFYIVTNSIFVQPIDTYNSNSRLFVEMCMIFCCLYLFRQLLLNRTYNTTLMRAPVTFISAVFLEASGSMIFYLYSNRIVEMHMKYSTLLFGLRLLVNYLVLLLIAYGLYQIYSKPTVSKRSAT